MCLQSKMLSLRHKPGQAWKLCKRRASQQIYHVFEGKIRFYAKSPEHPIFLIETCFDQIEGGIKMIHSKDKKIRKIAEDYAQSIGVHFFKVLIYSNN
jgi:hypothetical protein